MQEEPLRQRKHPRRYFLCHSSESTGSSVVQISVDVGLLMMLRTVISRVCGEALVAKLPYFLSGVPVEHAVIAEIFLQFQVAPVGYGGLPMAICRVPLAHF